MWDRKICQKRVKLPSISNQFVFDIFVCSQTIHPNLKKAHINARIERLNKNAAIDWSTAEALAVGSLLYQGKQYSAIPIALPQLTYFLIPPYVFGASGFNARISGQDVGRGTFSHRHFMIIDQSSNDVYVPLNHLSPEQVGKLEVGIG